MQTLLAESKDVSDGVPLRSMPHFTKKQANSLIDF